MSMQPKVQSRVSTVTVDESHEDTWTIERIIRWMQGFFAERRIDSPRLDAELLVAQALGKNRTYLYTHGDQPLTIVERDVLRSLVKRRASGEPMAYIRGTREFFGRDFQVSRAVLVPRPETEHIIEAVLAHVGRPLFPKSHSITDAPALASTNAQQIADDAANVALTYEPLQTGENELAPGGSELTYVPISQSEAEVPLKVEPQAAQRSSGDAGLRTSSDASSRTFDSPLRICDVGTGSGALAVTLAAELPHAFVTALDISDAALRIARANAQQLGVLERVAFVHSDLFSQLSPEEVAFDVIVSNPPYIGLSERPSLTRDVRDFEPAQALFAGDDGLTVLRALCAQVHRRLAPGGLFLTEIGHTQGPTVVELLRRAGAWTRVEIIPDLAGLDRVVLAERA